MGSPKTFEFRRQELAEMAAERAAGAGGSAAGVAVSDDEVTASFIDSVGPSGFVTRLLRLGVLGCRVGDTVFAHGSEGIILAFMFSRALSCPPLHNALLSCTNVS